jgi:hypothetical protein
MSYLKNAVIKPNGCLDLSPFLNKNGTISLDTIDTIVKEVPTKQIILSSQVIEILEQFKVQNSKVLNNIENGKYEECKVVLNNLQKWIDNTISMLNTK